MTTKEIKRMIKVFEENGWEAITDEREFCLGEIEFEPEEGAGFELIINIDISEPTLKHMKVSRQAKSWAEECRWFVDPEDVVDCRFSLYMAGAFLEYAGF